MTPDFGQIYDEYAERIYRFVYYKTYHRELAQDITSSVFLRAIEKQDQFSDKKGSMAGWLYTIARNLVTDHYRKEKDLLDIDDVWDLKSSDEVALDVENRAQMEELRTYLGELKAEQREVIILRIWMDLPYKEIAQTTGKSVASLKMSFARTVKHLKERMGESGFLALLMFPLFTQLKELL